MVAVIFLLPLATNYFLAIRMATRAAIILVAAPTTIVASESANLVVMLLPTVSASASISLETDLRVEGDTKQLRKKGKAKPATRNHSELSGLRYS